MLALVSKARQGGVLSCHIKVRKSELCFEFLFYKEGRIFFFHMKYGRQY